MATATPELVQQLLQQQFPAWSQLPLQPVAAPGHDNITYQLGTDMLVRLPSHQNYVAQVEKEQTWLPFLSKQLPLPIPTPLELGKPSTLFPFPWSIYLWLPGTSLNLVANNQLDWSSIATTLGGFLYALHQVDASQGPPAGTHNYWRGGNLSVYDEEARTAIASLRKEINSQQALTVWQQALSTNWQHAPVWVHGDIAAGNLLCNAGTLSAVIDFGCMGTGDPACDLVAAWTLFDTICRSQFQQAVGLDESTWQRAKGWALWKSAIEAVKLTSNHQDKNKYLSIINHITQTQD